MASTDAKPVPQKNVAYRVTFPILDADGDLVTGATGLDSEVSKDGGTFADCTNEATEIATNSGMYYLDLTNTEMNADTVAIIVKSSGKTTPIVLYPEEAGDIRVNVTQIESADPSDTIRDAVVDDATRIDASALNTASGTTTPAIAGYLDTEIAAIKAKTDNLPSDPADQSAVESAITAATSPLATAANLATVAGYLDTEIAAILADTNELQTDLVNGGRLDLLIDAIKAKTDNLPAAPAAAGDCLTAAGVRGAIGMSSANLDTQLEALPTAAENADAVWDEATSGHTTSGTFGEQLKTDVDAILADTNELQTDWANGGRLDVILDARASQTSVDDLPTNSELSTALAGADDAVLAAIDALPTAAENADAVWDEATAGHATGGTFGEQVKTDIDAIKAKTDALPAAPAAQGDIPSAATIADAVWDEATAGHTTGGTFGEQAKTDIDAIKAKTDNLPAAPAAQGDIPSAASIADAVWDEDATAHQTQGTFGQAIGDPGADASTIWDLANTNLDGTISSRASQASVDDLPTNGEMASALSVIEGKVDTVDTVADAIKAKTDNLPADPAGVSDLPDITTVEMYAEEIHRNSGLDALNPLTVTPTSREAGAIEIQITSDGGDGWIAERQ